MMQGKQQQRAMPIKHAKTTQKMAKKTSNARNTTANQYNRGASCRSISPPETTQ